MLAFGAKEVIIKLKIFKSENGTYTDENIQFLIEKGEERLKFMNK